MGTSNLTEQILREDISARNSDKYLIIEYLQRKGANLSEHQIYVMQSTSFESIRRTRQKLQEVGRYLPTNPVVIRQRRLKSYMVQQIMPKTKAEKVDKVIEHQPKAIPWLEEK